MPEPELPPLPGEITMEELMDLAHRLSEHPENRPGTDKTWVLVGMRQLQRYLRAPRTFVRIGPGGSFPPAATRPESDERR